MHPEYLSFHSGTFWRRPHGPLTQDFAVALCPATSTGLGKCPSTRLRTRFDPVAARPAACLRGDFGRLEIRAGANVQDTCILHAYPGNETVVEEEGHIGHGAILHGCTVKRNALVGMNAVVNDNAVIGESAVVAALAFVKSDMIVPPRTLVAGIPARVLRLLTDEELAWKAEGTASYRELTRRSFATLRATTPLAAPERDRRRIELPELLPLSARKARLA